MKKVNESTMKPGLILGLKGAADVFDVVQGELTAGVRIVRPESDVPERPHSHSQKQVIYVISGSGKITNGEETLDMFPGDFILLEPNEEHYVITEKEPLKVFEVKYP